MRHETVTHTVRVFDPAFPSISFVNVRPIADTACRRDGLGVRESAPLCDGDYTSHPGQGHGQAEHVGTVRHKKPVEPRCCRAAHVWSRAHEEASTVECSNKTGDEHKKSR